MKYAHNRIFQEVLLLKLTETLNAPIFVSTFMCRVVNEKNYWLIEMNNSKTPQALVFGFIVLNLVEKAVLRFFLNMLNYIKRVLRNKQLIIFNKDNLKGKSYKH